jgi:hypothetical protein
MPARLAAASGQVVDAGVARLPGSVALDAGQLIAVGDQLVAQLGLSLQQRGHPPLLGFGGVVLVVDQLEEVAVHLVGGRRGGAIGSVLDAVDTFYGEVLQHLKAWTVAPPRLREISGVPDDRPVLVSTALSSQDGEEPVEESYAGEAPEEPTEAPVLSTPSTEVGRLRSVRCRSRNWAQFVMSRRVAAAAYSAGDVMKT